MSRCAQYFPDMAIRLLNVFLSKIQCPPIVLQVTKRIGHCVLALWSFWDKGKFKLHLIKLILLSWFEEGLLVGLGGVGMVLKPGFQRVAAEPSSRLSQLSQMASESGRHTGASLPK